MASFQTFSVFFPVVIVLFLTCSPHLCESQSTQDLIDKICRSMEDYGFCNKTYGQSLKGASTDLRGLAEIAIQEAITNASNTHAFIVALMPNATDPGAKSALVACESGYNIVLQQFQLALRFFNVYNYKGALNAEFPTARAQASCDSYFTIPPYPKNMLGERNREMRILIAMSGVSLTLLDNP